ncbi:HNH endonuclease [Candidatus Woesearchaeota archaeon]|jgi:predicted restriction endonuclease|nr:HNH endonuclease [Candidatus Woesearchaeota archaeon]
MLSINKRNVNIIAYYTSRFLDAETNKDVVENESYNKLGFQTRTEFHISIANQFGVKQSYVKNMEDSYDSIHENHRRGWHQRDLRPAQQQIVDILSQKDEDELFAMVKSLMNNNATAALTTLKYKTASDDWGEASDDDINELHKFVKRIRKGQPKFRKNLLKLYSSKCVITNCAIKEVLEAAHIEKHAETGINHSSNGLLLRSDIHSLFDSNKIKINPDDYTVEVDKSLKSSDYWQYNGKKINQGLNGEFPSREYLVTKYEN